MVPTTVVGSVVADGNAKNVVIGFLPDYVELVNRTSGAMLKRFRGSANSVKTVVAGTITVAAGITDYDANAVGQGFTIPVDAQVNVNTQVIDYLAVRSGPGAH